MNFFVFCIFAFIGFIVVSYIEVFYYVFKLIKESITILLDCISTKHRNELIKSRNAISTNNSMSEQPIYIDSKVKIKVDNMRMKYPFADEELFNKYLKTYNSLPLYEIERLENAIMHSHYKNENGSENKQIKHKISEVLASKSFDEVYVFPVTMKFYKLGIEYVLSLENNLTNEIIMYQSRSHKELLDIAYEIHDNVCLKKQQNEDIAINNLFTKENYKNVIEIH